MDRFYTFLLGCILASLLVSGQISSPGLGETNTASWNALGVKQNLDSANKKQYMAYVGIGRMSIPSNYNMYQIPAIIVVNQEFYNQYRKHWQYAVALSYRRQNEYEGEPLSNATLLKFQEFRIYGRYVYTWKNPRIRFVTYFRPEFRKFFTLNFKEWDEVFQLRERLKTQVVINLDNHKTHHIMVSAEALFSISRENSVEKWNNFDYRESRFCLYYTVNPPKTNLAYSIGYMNNLIGKQNNLVDVHYLCMDLVWTNPYKGKKNHKPTQ